MGKSFTWSAKVITSTGQTGGGSGTVEGDDNYTQAAAEKDVRRHIQKQAPGAIADVKVTEN